MPLRTLIVCAALCAVSAAAPAQQAPRHQGLHLALGVGQGKLRNSCTECVNPPHERANVLTLRAGWTVHDLFVVAIEGLIYDRQAKDGRGDQIGTTYQLVTANAIAYAGRRTDLFLKIGGGISHTTERVDLHGAGRQRLNVTAPAIRVGTGIDLRFGRRWSVSPFVDNAFGFRRETSFYRVDFKSLMLIFGATLTWP
jgi:hypothetical protein